MKKLKKMLGVDGPLLTSLRVRDRERERERERQTERE
jgi:hypothetical protein